MLCLFESFFFNHQVNNCLCRISQINSKYMQEYCTIKFREIPEGLSKGKKSKIKIQLLCEKSGFIFRIMWRGNDQLWPDDSSPGRRRPPGSFVGFTISCPALPYSWPHSDTAGPPPTAGKFTPLAAEQPDPHYFHTSLSQPLRTVMWRWKRCGLGVVTLSKSYLWAMITPYNFKLWDTYFT